MAYATGTSEQLYTQRIRNILAHPEFVGSTYTFDSTTIGADTYGVKTLRPGLLVTLDPTTEKLKPATAASDPVWPILSFYTIAMGDEQVEVVIGGQVVEQYCYGIAHASTYAASNYGVIPTAVKSKLPLIVWK